MKVVHDNMKKIWVNGTFDVLHIGHIKLLEFASKYGIVRVCIDSDIRVKQLKGEFRPINTISDKDNYNKLVPKSIRIVNDKDLVTRIPKIGYTHINEGITLNEKGEVITYSSINPFRHVVEIFISDVSGEAIKDHMVDNYLKVVDKWDGINN